MVLVSPGRSRARSFSRDLAFDLEVVLFLAGVLDDERRLARLQALRHVDAAVGNVTFTLCASASGLSIASSTAETAFFVFSAIASPAPWPLFRLIPDFGGLLAHSFLFFFLGAQHSGPAQRPPPRPSSKMVFVFIPLNRDPTRTPGGTGGKVCRLEFPGPVAGSGRCGASI